MTLTRAGSFAVCAGLLLSLLAACADGGALAVREPVRWGRWTQADPLSRTVIDHTAWDRMLDKYITRDAAGVNRFAYHLLAGDDGRRLNRYIQGLTEIRIGTFNRAEQFAFWVNLYNALTVKLVAESYPVASIRAIKLNKQFDEGPWNRKLVEVNQTPISLNDILHRILRPIWREPRVHYLLTTAAVGGPNLPRFAVTSANMEQLMERGASDFINNARGVTVNNGQLRASYLYLWFRSDFGATAEKILDHMRRYAKPPLKSQLAGITTMGLYIFDWPLNDIR